MSRIQGDRGPPLLDRARALALLPEDRPPVEMELRLERGIPSLPRLDLHRAVGRPKRLVVTTEAVVEHSQTLIGGHVLHGRPAPEETLGFLPSLLLHPNVGEVVEHPVIPALRHREGPERFGVLPDVRVGERPEGESEKERQSQS